MLFQHFRFRTNTNLQPVRERKTKRIRWWHTQEIEKKQFTLLASNIPQHCGRSATNLKRKLMVADKDDEKKNYFRKRFAKTGRRKYKMLLQREKMLSKEFVWQFDWCLFQSHTLLRREKILDEKEKHIKSIAKNIHHHTLPFKGNRISY